MALDDGSAELSFETDRVTLAEIDGTAVIVHALPDNFHNIPLVGPDGYTPNSPNATIVTDNTGNAGARIGCGVIE
jgi:Cu-Zn family superoxide dismutase